MTHDFKSGQKVKRVFGIDIGGVKLGEIYTVKDAAINVVSLEELTGMWDPANFDLVEDHTEAAVVADNVNHPAHYKFANGVEVIALTEQLTFNVGNAVKYLARAGRKDPATALEDLKKAAWYVARELQRLENA